MRVKKIFISFMLVTSILVAKETNTTLGDILQPVETRDLKTNVIKKRKPKVKKPHPIIEILKQITLTDEQKSKLILLNREKRRKIAEINSDFESEEILDYYSKDGFDVKNFKKESLERYNKILDIKALYVQKSFDILTKAQKEDFIIKLDKYKKDDSK